MRQSLFTYADAEKKKEKAKTAAFRVKEIHPGVVSVLKTTENESILLNLILIHEFNPYSKVATGHNVHIPMPGYTIGESLKKQAIQSLKTIEELIESHDVIYLLTDSRESRWLPTMLAAAHDKVTIKHNSD